MYVRFSWRILKEPCQLLNSQCLSRLYSSQKVLTKHEATKLNSYDQGKFSKVIQLNDKNDILLNSNISNSSPLDTDVESWYTNNNNNTKVKNKRWRIIETDTSKLGNYYLKLSKFRLTSLVVMTSTIGYAMSPSSFDAASFLSCAVGTGLVSSAANTINQFLEIPFDAQMSRTRSRVLVQGHLSPLHAIGFATAAGSVGLLILYAGTNALTAMLGVSNLLLYTTIYTPLKRISIINTWVGSVVGAIPPLMGWAACEGSLGAGAFILGGILYAWQFPHFNALSWNLRPDYSKAGYRMMAVTNPDLCRKTALKYTLCITAFSSLVPVCNISHWCFGVLSLPINLYFTLLAFKFFKQSDSKNSRKLFRFSLLHLPLLMGLMVITKQGLFTSTKNVSNEELVLSNTEDSCGSLARQLIDTKEEHFQGSKVLHISV